MHCEVIFKKSIMTPCLSKITQPAQTLKTLYFENENKKMSTTEIYKFKCRYINKNMMQQTTLTNETSIYVECSA